jgi:L-ascorbate metabolism protein UlaG (beta-lactamase superfamily)
MLGARLTLLVPRVAVLLASMVLVGLVAPLGSPLPTPAAAQGTVRLEWLGHQFYRLTSPQGVQVITSPWLDNPSGPVSVEELTHTNVILVPNSHPDDMGNPIPISEASGATVLAPGPLGRWLIDNGLDQGRFRRAGIGDTVLLNNLRIKVGPNAHDNTLANGADGGPAASYFVTFENGFTVFFTSHASLLGDLPLYAAIYQPDLAIMGVTNDAAEWAQMAQLLATNNPKLRTVIASHQPPGAPILEEARQELSRLGLGELWFMPELRTTYEY